MFKGCLRIFPLKSWRVIIAFGFYSLFIHSFIGPAETIKLQATADIWLSAFNERERNSSSGKVERFKLKSNTRE
jgi:hypothetical protein